MEIRKVRVVIRSISVHSGVSMFVFALWLGDKGRGGRELSNAVVIDSAKNGPIWIDNGRWWRIDGGGWIVRDVMIVCDDWYQEDDRQRINEWCMMNWWWLAKSECGLMGDWQAGWMSGGGWGANEIFVSSQLLPAASGCVGEMLRWAPRPALRMGIKASIH